MTTLMIAISPLSSLAAEPGMPNAGSILQQVQPVVPQKPSSNETGLSIEQTDSSKTSSKEHLIVTADNQTRLYGQANPVLTQTISGFVNGETLATSGVSGSATGTTSAVADTPVGTVPIRANAGSLAASNYDFPNLIDGALTINKAHLTVKADNQSRLYGQANPVLTETISGFVNGETLETSGVSGSATGITSAEAGTPVGTVPIRANAGSLTASNYDFANPVDGTLAIIPIPVSQTGVMLP